MCFPDGEPWDRWRVAEYGRCVARYDEEQLVSYEAGFESTLGDGRLRFSGAAFCYDYSELAELEVAALVVHGTEDPILPYPHGVALAETIPGATLMTLEGAGHEMPDLYLDEMIDAMIEVSERAA